MAKYNHLFKKRSYDIPKNVEKSIYRVDIDMSSN
jgi:hypothetical protein